MRKQQVTREHRAAGHIGEHAQCRADHHHRHDGQAVQSVGQVDGVTRTHNDQIGQGDKTPDPQRIADFLEERQQQPGLRWQIDVEPGLHPFEKQLQHADVGIFRDAEHQVQGSHQADDGLPEVLFPGTHALGVLVHDFAPVIDPTDGTKTQGDYQDDPDEAVRPVKPQQGGNRDAQQHQHATHGRGAALAVVRLHAIVTDRLPDLQPGQVAYHRRAGEQAYHQRRHRRQHGAQCQVLEHAEKPELGRQRLQPLGQCQQHDDPPASRSDCMVLPDLLLLRQAGHGFDHPLHAHEA